jgi:hypothetical protein
MAQIAGNRSINSVELISPNSVRVLFETTMTNSGSEILDAVEFIYTFPETVELPGPSEVTIKLRGDAVSQENIELKKDRSEEAPNYNVFRILLRNLNDTVGGLQPKEEITVTFPVYQKIDLQNILLSQPAYLNAVVNEDTPLIEETATDAPLSQAHVVRAAVSPGSGRKLDGSSFENQVIDKFAKLAVDAYNEGKYEDAMLYCDEILSVANTVGDQAIVQNFTNISAKLKQIIERNASNVQSSASAASQDD